MHETNRAAVWLLFVLLLIVPGVATPNPSAPTAGAPGSTASRAESAGDPAPPSQEMLLSQLDRAQARLDGARLRAHATGLEARSTAMIDTAQRMLDQARSQLVGKTIAPYDPDLQRSLWMEMRAQLDDVGGDLEESIQRLGDRPGFEASRGLLELARRQLEHAKSQGPSSAVPATTVAPGRDPSHALFDDAARRLAAVRSLVHRSTDIDQAAMLRQLEDAERRLREARRDAVALGLVD